MRGRWQVIPSFVLLVALASAPPLEAADPALEQAKSLYEAASFEDALAAINRIDPALGADAEVLLYKALCLLALGRAQEAGIATKTLVTVTPTFAPDTASLPPRFQTLWTDTRRAVLPLVSRELFGAARVRFQAKDYVPALEQFEQVLAFANDPAWKDTMDAADLRTLAEGFIDLSQAAIPKPEPVPAPVAVVEPPPAPAPMPVVIEPAQVLRQDFPVWNPPDRLIARQSFAGTIRVAIDATGRVTDATIVAPTHISYDTLLLRAARDWRYRPALRNGQPIASERVVEVRLTAANEE